MDDLLLQGGFFLLCCIGTLWCLGRGSPFLLFWAFMGGWLLFSKCQHDGAIEGSVGLTGGLMVVATPLLVVLAIIALICLLFRKS